MRVTPTTPQADALKDFDDGELDLNSPITVAGQETSAGRLKYRFADVDDALLAVERNDIDMQDTVTVKVNGETITTSPGRLYFARMVQETLSEDGGEVPVSMIRYDTAYEKKCTPRPRNRVV